MIVQADTFARLLVRSPGGDADAEPPDKVELAADWRAHPPVLLAVGPVPHQDDAVANKMCALYGRAPARDFLDVDAAIVSGRYSRARLLELAANADAGFDPVMFAHALGALSQITDAAFAEYGTFFDVRGLVPRPLTIHVEHTDIDGHRRITAFERDLARIV